jgi:carbonic anhydrase
LHDNDDDDELRLRIILIPLNRGENYRFPMEMHLVHRGPGGKLLVIALLFKYGEASSLLEEVINRRSNYNHRIKLRSSSKLDDDHHA